MYSQNKEIKQSYLYINAHKFYLAWFTAKFRAILADAAWKQRRGLISQAKGSRAAPLSDFLLCSL